jgi:hypothetical protein
MARARIELLMRVLPTATRGGAIGVAHVELIDDLSRLTAS